MTAQIVRIASVVALLGAAAAIATPKGRLPLAIRGICRVMRKGRGEGASTGTSAERVPAWRRLVAFILVLSAAVLAVL